MDSLVPPVINLQVNRGILSAGAGRSVLLSRFSATGWEMLFYVCLSRRITGPEVFGIRLFCRDLYCLKGAEVSEYRLPHMFHATKLIFWGARPPGEMKGLSAGPPPCILTSIVGVAGRYPPGVTPYILFTKLLFMVNGPS